MNFTFSDPEIIVPLILPYLHNISSQQQITQMQEQPKAAPMVLGYYPFRAKGQISRLLCQYLHLDYVDRFFNPEEWNVFKETEGKKWVLKDLPYLQDGDFVVTGPIGIATYLVEKSGRMDLFGKNAEDQAEIDQIRMRCDLRTAMIGMTCVTRPNCQLENKKCMTYYWQKKIKPILLQHQHQCQLNPWFFPYITIMDFVVYQLINQLERIFPQEIPKFKKLHALRQRVSTIKEIKEYEASPRAVTEYCPMTFFNTFKEEKLKSSRGPSSASSTGSRSSRGDMDLQ